LSDGTPEEPKLKEFLDNPYVVLLQPTLEVSLMSGKLQYRFDSKRMPELKTKAIAAGRAIKPTGSRARTARF